MSLSDSTSSLAGNTQAGSTPAFKALDSAGAIALLDDSTELYVEIAQAYQQEIAGLPERVDGLLQQTDLTEGTRALHTLKGLSLTVGANQLSEVCRLCEVALKSLRQQGQALDVGTRQAMVGALADATAVTQQALVAMLASLSPTAAASGAMPLTSAGSAELVGALRALQKLLAESNLQALDDYSALRARHGEHAGAMNELDQALKAFDFGQAVVQCDELIRRFGANP